MIKLTKEQLLEFQPCAEGLRFAEECNFDFVKIWHTCPRGDWLLWLLRRVDGITKEQAVTLACEFAERVLPLFEKKHPADLRPRAAIEAARVWLQNPTEANRSAYASAASAAASAAAYAASAAAYAAASAAAAADAAADAYAAAADAERPWQADRVRAVVACPFEEGQL